jgi:membrane-bound lytic murein transglycosylase B
MFKKMIIWGSALLCSLSIYADEQMLNRPNVQQFIQRMVKEEHFSRQQVTSIIRQAQFQPIIIEKITTPYEGKPWDVYKNLFLTSMRIDGGVQFWHEHRATLAEAERKYGVPANIIVGILGVETTYGRQQGSFRVLDALTTLAFYYPQRAPYFSYELKEYLLMCRDYHLNAIAQVGSYAGAMGQGQFMPSSYRRWAVKYQGNGAPDIIHHADDAIFSIANYLSQHGWHRQERIVEPAVFTHGQCLNVVPNLKKATYSLQQLAHCGIKTKAFRWTHPQPVGFLDYLLTNGHEYWIGYPNFYVILTYNSSPLYGLVVYLLGNAIQSKV